MSEDREQHHGRPGRRLTGEVLASWQDTSDPRLREILKSLTGHLHAFLEEVEPTQQEWRRGIDYLTATGQLCDGTRQEFILLSDVLGVSMLVDEINHRQPAGATESTVLGPFHVVDSPVRALGDDISLDGVGTPCVVAGRVLDLAGDPVPGALVDVWQANGDGFYDVQQPGVQPELNLRGLFTADGQGRYWFRTVVPRHYPIPDDGPVGDLLAATGRHPNRPAHVHVIAGAQGFSPVTTHVFVEGSPYLDSDAVFGVKPSLVRAVRTETDADLAASYGVAAPFALLEFDLVLAPADR
jgi:protocatechuate 3,4-dioxygenase beta subunit